MTEQEYQDYKSKYLMLYAKHKKDREVVSVLNDVDFCIELMESDRINVAYIMNLIRNIHFDDAKQKDYDIKHIYDKKKGESYLHIGPPKTKTSQPLLLDWQNKADRASNLQAVLFPFFETKWAAKGKVPRDTAYICRKSH